MSKVVAFTVADENNLKYARGLKNSLSKTNPNLEFVIFGPQEIAETKDPHIFYRATPFFGYYLMDKGYDVVIKIDADSVVTSDLSHTWSGEFDVGVVHNSNPRELKKAVVALQGIGPNEYLNCGFVVMKDLEFVKFWMALCLSPRFGAFQYREQDILNNIIYWGRFRPKFLDLEGDKWHGLIARGYELEMRIKNGKLILPQNSAWPQDGNKEIVCYHHAGGDIPNKLNFNIVFKPAVAKFLTNLVK